MLTLACCDRSSTPWA